MKRGTRIRGTGFKAMKRGTRIRGTGFNAMKPEAAA